MANVRTNDYENELCKVGFKINIDDKLPKKMSERRRRRRSCHTSMCLLRCIWCSRKERKNDMHDKIKTLFRKK